VSLLKIVTYGHPILRQVAQPVIRFDAALRRLSDNMFDTMRHAEGIGLAAPQIGKSIRIFVVDIAPIVDGYPPMTFVNPEILSSSGLGPYNEGCLSIPGISAEVMRPERIELRYTTLEGQTVEGVAEGVMARVIQHELDHLDGKLFIDYLSDETLESFRPVLEKLASKNKKRLAGKLP
jgi:peptide deformylase